MINNEPRFELWEWSEDDLDPETVLELENFALSMSHFYSQFLAIISYHIFSAYNPGYWNYFWSTYTHWRNCCSQSHEITSTRSMAII